MTMIDALQPFVIHLAQMEVPVFNPIIVHVLLDGLATFARLVRELMNNDYDCNTI